MHLGIERIQVEEPLFARSWPEARSVGPGGTRLLVNRLDGEATLGIAPEDGSADVFVHYTEIQGSGFRTLEENQKVEFEVGQSPKGPQATGVRAI